MGGFFGVVSKVDCINDLYYGTDYHSHLGTKRGGLAVWRPDGFVRVIHSIENDLFRSKFDQDISVMHSRRDIEALRQIFAHLDTQLHAPKPGCARPGRQDAAHSYTRAYRRQKVSFLRGLDCPGTQLKDTMRRLYDVGAVEVYMRPACPPLVFGCKFLNFSTSRSKLDLAARKAIRELEGENVRDLSAYAHNGTEQYQAMEERIRRRLNLTTLKYQRLEDLIEAINLPKHKVCTYCWDGVEGS